MTKRSSDSFSNLQTKEMLVVVFDLTHFASFSREADSSVVFQTLDRFYSMSRKTLGEYGGTLIKFIADGGLAVFESYDADRGVRAMLTLKDEVDRWISTILPKAELAVNCHLGEVTIGEITAPNGRQLEVVGEAVNVAFALGKRQFLLSPQAFRALSPDCRKLFYKFTPPVVYRLSEDRDL